MADKQNQDQQDGSKTLVSFVVGLLIGGMLVWAFSGPTATNVVDGVTDMADEAGDVIGDGVDTVGDAIEGAADTATDVAEAVVPNTDGRIVANNQPAGATVSLQRATYPISEGWVGVQDYDGTTFGAQLGAVRFSESEGIAPEEIPLTLPTTPGRQYAFVVYEADGYTLLDGIYGTFVAE